MPASFIPRRVEDFILYYYAKLVIASSAGLAGNYRFVVDTYRRLKSGQIHMSDYDRELLHLAQRPNVCVYCGVRGSNLVPSEVVPREFGGPVGIHNVVMVCQQCNGSKDGKDLVEWWRNTLGKHHDALPRVPAGLYLKIAYEHHQVNFSLREKCTNLGQVFLLLKKGRGG